MVSNKITENELLEDLAKEYENRQIGPDEVTAQMLAERTGITRRTASNRLNGDCESGKLTKRQAFIDGHWVNVYKQKE